MLERSTQNNPRARSNQRGDKELRISARHRAAQRPVPGEIEPIAATYIDRRGGGDLHRPLGSARFVAPHPRIGTVAGFRAIDRESDTIEIGNRGRSEQVEIRRMRSGAPQDADGPHARIGEAHHFQVHGASPRLTIATRSLSPRITLTELCRESLNVMVSAVSAYMTIYPKLPVPCPIDPGGHPSGAPACDIAAETGRDFDRRVDIYVGKPLFEIHLVDTVNRINVEHCIPVERAYP
jgi:hypothetical protein